MPPHPVFAPAHTALITGAASGIGLAIAQLCRRHGMALALVDNNSEKLAEAQKSLGSAAATESYCMDVSDIEEWKGLKAKVESKFKSIQFLVLNAGIGPPSSWEDPDSFQKVRGGFPAPLVVEIVDRTHPICHSLTPLPFPAQIFATNLFGATNGLSTFLPLLLASAHPSAIVLTGSKQGITNPPGNPGYNASKAALKSLAESLSYDLRAKSNITVHLLVPGWTFTGLSGGGKGGKKPEGAWWPEQVARRLEEKMAEGAFYVVCPDGDTTEGMDCRRMLWGVGDLVEGRPALSRWREEWKGRAGEWIAGQE